ncbi:MAG: diguanylate cyclase [Azoarcus sp.]|jgi:diguanylate cyclase (GGDEF)-like protein|nr:diguanylate cyclase [Azoarcus sp.]
MIDTSSNATPRQSILIVDDKKTNLALLNKILAPEYTILAARSGEEALKRLAENLPDLILLDTVMPGMDGFEVISRLKREPATQRIPVIFISGPNDAGDEEKSFNLGAVDYIGKPFKEVIVRARVRNHLQILRQMSVIERLGLLDPLTDIASRRSFDEHLPRVWESAVRERKPLALLMMDIDNFKAYNDTHGRPQGDVLLKRIACLIKSATAHHPLDICARIGGEEFVVLCPETDHVGALDIAEQLRLNVENMKVLSFDRKPTSATISIGVASVIPTNDDEMTSFIKLADERLYAAKTNGRNRIVG